MYLVFSFCPIRFSLPSTWYISLPQEADIYRLHQQTPCPPATCHGLAIGKHRRRLEIRKRMRSEYLFPWPFPARLWLETLHSCGGSFFLQQHCPRFPGLLSSFSSGLRMINAGPECFTICCWSYSASHTFIRMFSFVILHYPL